MTKFELALARLAYVAKMLIAIAGVAATAALGVTDLPVAWKLPLSLVAAVATAITVFKVPNGPSVQELLRDKEIRELIGQKFKPSQDSGGDVE